jgi:hypothetical protein
MDRGRETAGPSTSAGMTILSLGWSVSRFTCCGCHRIVILTEVEGPAVYFPVFFSESRMQSINATGLTGKSGGAQWRDLRFAYPVSPYCRCCN